MKQESQYELLLTQDEQAEVALQEEALTTLIGPVILAQAGTIVAERKEIYPDALMFSRNGYDLTEEEIDQMVELHRAGQTYEEIGAVLFVGRNVVMRKLLERGVKPRRVGRRSNDVPVGEAAELYKNGKTLRDLALKYAVSVDKIAYLLKNEGVEMRPNWPRKKS